ncbi:MAG: tripartite tricarboxylate transporter permease [Hyphomicrobiaceae bacterium]|nr:tripartite tricarboxylate transporter permease [Hyphomicrobiaceae bacterium]
MLDLVEKLTLGFRTCLEIVWLTDPVFGLTIPLPVNIALCFFGCLIGTLIGVLPGLGPIATIAILLPVTYSLPPVGALIMLAGIYYGAQYGGSTTAILASIPGEATSVVTVLDGHQMARHGRAGAALAIAAIGSFVAGTFATLLIAAIGQPLTRLALLFGPADYFSLMVLGLLFAVVLARGSLSKAIAMIVLGVLLSTVGNDIETGEERLTFGWSDIADGIDFAVVAMGVFGLAELLRNLESPETRETVEGRLGPLMPTADEMRRSVGPIARGTLLGSLLGLLPGNGAVLGPFASYTLEKKIAHDPDRFGKGAIEGVAGPEAANNAGAQTAFIPLLALGIPPNAVMALMLGAMTLKNVIPGPDVITKQPALFWGMIASMWIGNLMLLVINLPLIGLWVRLLKVPYRLLFPAIVLLCCIGIYSVGNNPMDVYLTAGFTLLGYALLKLGFEPAPLLLGFVLGRLMEEKLRQALAISRGSMATFVHEPLSAGLLALAVVLLVVSILPAIRRGRDRAFVE